MSGPGGEARARKPKRRRLSRSAEFERVYREGRSHANRYLVFYSFPRRGEDADHEPRLGVSVGRKVGGAVDRNKVKRALREAFWSLSEELPDDHDFVIIGRPEIGELVEREGTDGVRSSLDGVIREAGIAAERST